MQLLIILQPQSTPFVIPKDYSYLLSSAIYSLIKQSDKEFAKFSYLTPAVQNENFGKTAGTL